MANDTVREAAPLSTVPLTGPARARARMPTPEERRDLRLDEGVPVLVVDRAGELRVLSADRMELDLPWPS